MSDGISGLIRDLVVSCPIYIVYLIGFIVCAQRWQSHSRVCAFVAGGLFFYTVASIAGRVGYILIGHLMQTNGFNELMHIAMLAVSGFTGLLHATGTALLLCGAFAGRQPADESLHPL